MEKLRKIFIIIYVIFLVNGGLGLFVTKYRIIVEIPLFILIVMQYRNRLKKFIFQSELRYVLLRLCLIVVIGLNFTGDMELLFGKRIIGSIIVAISVIIIYQKWLAADIDRIKKIPHVQYLYGGLGVYMVSNLFGVNIGIINIGGVALLLLFLLEVARDNAIEKIKRQIAWILFCWCNIIFIIGIIVKWYMSIL